MISWRSGFEGDILNNVLKDLILKITSLLFAKSKFVGFFLAIIPKYYINQEKQTTFIVKDALELDLFFID